jgi:hypothetical protein
MGEPHQSLLIDVSKKNHKREHQLISLDPRKLKHALGMPFAERSMDHFFFICTPSHNVFCCEVNIGSDHLLTMSLVVK